MNNPNAIDNLIPAKPGEVRNPKGRGRVKSWATIVKKLLADETFAEKILQKKPGWWDSLPNKNLGYAIAAAMMHLALNGDPKAAEWIRKTGFGDKLDLTSDDKPIQPIAIYDLRTDEEREDESAETEQETSNSNGSGEES